MTLTAVVIYGLAAWRVSSMLVREAGPGDIFLRLRVRAGIGHDDEKIPVILPDGLLPGVLSCVWCCSVWVGFGWLALDWLFPVVSLKLAAAFAFSAVAIGMQRLVER